MTCQECKELASTWFDGEDGSEKFSDLLIHIEGCEQCRSFMASLPRQARLVKELRTDCDCVPSRFGDMVPIQETGRFFSAYIRAPLAAAAAIILVVLTLAIQSNVDSDRDARHRMPENRNGLAQEAETR